MIFLKGTERGASNLALFFILLFLGVGGFIGWNVLPFFYYHQEAQGLAEFQAKKGSVLRDIEIRKTLLKRMKELQIPMDDEDDLQINRVGGNIVIHYEYEEVFYVDLGKYGVHDLWVFPFEIHAEAPVK